LTIPTIPVYDVVAYQFDWENTDIEDSDLSSVREDFINNGAPDNILLLDDDIDVYLIVSAGQATCAEVEYVPVAKLHDGIRRNAILNEATV
jgi:hypothetical protein